MCIQAERDRRLRRAGRTIDRDEIGCERAALTMWLHAPALSIKLSSVAQVSTFGMRPNRMSACVSSMKLCDRYRLPSSA
jgi:hypothetical protein